MLKLVLSKRYIFTLTAQLLSLLLAVAAIKLAAVLFDAANFGLYNVVRRYITILNYPLLFGLGISIPIYVAKAYMSRIAQAHLVTTGFLWWIFLTILLTVLNLLIPDVITKWLLGEGYEYLTWPILFGFSCLYLYTILYASYRGEQNFGRANVFQVFSAGIIPLIALYMSSGIVERYLYIYAALMFSANVLVLIDLYKRKLLSRTSKEELRVLSEKFLKFGLPRMPGEFALFGLMSSPLFIISKYDSLEMAGYVAIGFTLVQFVASLFEFIGTLMLPKSAQLISDGRYEELNHLVRKLSLYSFLVACLVSLIIYFNLEYLLGLLDRNKFIDHIEYARIIIFCIPFYIVYLIIRNPQDALSLKPFNTYNLSACFLLQLILLLITVNIAPPCKKLVLYHLSVIVPFILLGLLTFINWNHQIKKHLG